MREASEARLARRAAEGDERAFAAIFRRHHQALYRFCMTIVGNPEDAQDALQNTMVKVLRALPGEEREIALKPWLYRIAHNESIEVLRRRREAPELDAELPAPGPGIAEQAGTRERLRSLLDDLDELPERQRETLVMRELAGLGFAEIGAALGTSEGVARQTVYEARRSLRQMGEGREMSCESVMQALSDGDGRVARGREIRAHLRSCADCRRFREEIQERRRDFAAIAPLPALAATGILQGLLAGGAGGSGSAGLATAVGGGAAHTVGASAVLKGVATVAVVAAVGAGAADRGGLIDAGLPGGGGSSEPAPAVERDAGATQGSPGESPAGTETDGQTGKRDGAEPGVDDARSSNPDSVDGPAGSGDGTAAGEQPAATAEGTNGTGHEKSLPSAAQHGQQTAAANKGGQHGAATGKGKGSAGHPAKPPKPSHPPAASPEKSPKSPPPNSGAEGLPPPRQQAAPAVPGSAPEPAEE